MIKTQVKVSILTNRLQSYLDNYLLASKLFSEYEYVVCPPSPPRQPLVVAEHRNQISRNPLTKL